MSTPPRPTKTADPLGAQNERKRRFVPTDPDLLDTRVFYTTGPNGIPRNSAGNPILPSAPGAVPKGTFVGWNSRKDRKSRKARKTRKVRKARKSRKIRKN